MLRICLLGLLSAAAFGQDSQVIRDLRLSREAREAALGAQIAEEVRRQKKTLGSAPVEEYVVRLGPATIQRH